MPVRPSAKDMRVILRLEDSLTRIADRKDAGKITPERAKREATDAVKAAKSEELKSVQRKSLEYLERICANGWVREAALKVPDLYPYLRRPNLWTSGC